MPVLYRTMKTLLAERGEFIGEFIWLYRVSTRDQNEDRQLIALLELKIPEKNIFMDSSLARTSTVRNISGWCGN